MHIAMTVASTPPSSPLFSGHIPESKSRELVDSLLDDGEQLALMDAVAIETDREDDLPEMVCGWGCSVSLPKPSSSSFKRVGRRKPERQQVPDIDISRITVRCVSEDYNADPHRAAWKANVEPGTYRYIANNGIYRSTKFASTGTEWITAKRSRHSERITTTTPEVRQAQRTLRKDLDQHFRSHDTPKSESQPQPQSQSQPQSRHAPNLPPSAPPTINQSSAKENYTGLTTKDRLKDPGLVKSASDLFVENFSSRMTALEREMTICTSKSPDGPPKPGTTPHAAVSAIHSVNSRRHNENAAPDTAKFLAQQADDISKDVFTVKPVTRVEQPLKPLEKLTPQQKMVEQRASESDKGSNASHSNPASPALSTSFMTAMNAFAQIHHQYHRDGQASKSSPSTFRSHHKHHLHGGAGSGHFSSNSSDTDSLSSVRNAITLTNIDIEKMRMNHVAMKDYGRFLMGKAKMPSETAHTIKPFGGQRKGVVGYKPVLGTNQGSSSTNTVTAPGPIVTSTSADLKSMTSDVTVDVTPPVTGRMLRETKSSSMSLPEISGKRLAVTSTSHRLL